MGNKLNNAPTPKRELKKVLAEVCTTPVLGDAYKLTGFDRLDTLILVGDKRYPKQPWHLDITSGIHQTLGIRTISAAFSGNAFGDTIVQFHAYLTDEQPEHRAYFDDAGYRTAPPRRIFTPFDQHDIRKRAVVTDVSDRFLSIGVEDRLSGDQYPLASVETTQPIRPKHALSLIQQMGGQLLQIANAGQVTSEYTFPQSFAATSMVQ